MDPDLEQRLRSLPSVDELLRTEPFRSAASSSPRSLALSAAREAIECRRRELLESDGRVQVDELASEAAAALERLESSSLRPVVNATGVVIHTNLGRAPLAAQALAAVERACGYSTLEYDLERGGRGSRQQHVESLICELTGAEAAIAVNNNAAAVMLALAALAAGREVVISRGQLVEIGGSFRIPEILAASGARLVEVGTTNRTRIADYERAIGDGTAVLMRVHASNFRTVGFTEEVAIEELCVLARAHGLVAIDDLGSGLLDDDGPVALAGEPPARRSVAAGADVICFSADKLLGGPQAGVVAGRGAAIERLRSHPVARAVRIDKLSLAALEATLRLHRDPARAVAELPVLRMLSAPETELERRAESLRESIGSRVGRRADVELARAIGRAGGGTLPLLELEGPVVRVRPRSCAIERLESGLRAHDPPVIARVHEGALELHARTISDADARMAADAVVAAVERAERDP